MLAKQFLIARPGSYPSQFLQMKFLELVLGTSFVQAFQVVLVEKNPPTEERDVTDMSSATVLGRSPGGGHGNPLQYSCLDNPIDRGAWWATVHGVAKS